MKSPATYDVLVVGAGPAGLAAVESLHDSDASICVVEAGRAPSRRPCPADSGRDCRGCSGHCNVIEGIGGCVHTGDSVKLSLLPSGRRLLDVLGDEKAHSLCRRALNQVLRHAGKVDTQASVPSSSIRFAFGSAGLPVREYPVAVLSAEEVARWLHQCHARLENRCDLRLGNRLVRLQRSRRGDLATLTEGTRTEIVGARSVVIAMGRAGLTMMRHLASDLRLSRQAPRPSMGVRIEVPRSALSTTGDSCPDLKISLRGENGIKLKTFCFCGGTHGGRVKLTNYQHNFPTPLLSLDGHIFGSPEEAHGESANFGLLLQEPAPVHDINGWLRRTVQEPLAAISKGQIAAQDWDSFRSRSLPSDECLRPASFKLSMASVVPSRLDSLFSDSQHAVLQEAFVQISEALVAVNLDGMSAQSLREQSVLLGPEVEFMWETIDINSCAETSSPGLFVAGDSAGAAQGILQAMMLGAAAGDEICTRLDSRSEAVG